MSSCIFRPSKRWDTTRLKGSRVSFAVKTAPKGLQAEHVTLAQDGREAQYCSYTAIGEIQTALKQAMTRWLKGRELRLKLTKFAASAISGDQAEDRWNKG